MQVQLNFLFDLGSPAGRAEFQRLFQHMLLPAETPVVLSEDPSPPARSSSIPDDPARAAAALAGRQAAAAKARAAKAAKQPPGPDALVGGGEDLSGPPANGEDPDTDDMGLADPSMSPGEAKEAGLALVRQMYAAGKVAEVKKLQKDYQVAKFYDVPLEKAHEFYARVLKISHAVMGQQSA